jgi:hypothetical protein
MGLCGDPIRPFRDLARLKFICDLDVPMLFLILKKEIPYGYVEKVFYFFHSPDFVVINSFERLCSVGIFFSTRMNFFFKKRDSACVEGSVEVFFLHSPD